jgi:hypothetical protein
MNIPLEPRYKELLAKIGAEQFTFIPGSAQHDALMDALDAAYKAGAASVQQAASEEADLVCQAVEDVAERQMNNTADAAIFALMISLPPHDIARQDGVTVDFDWVREAINDFRFHKSYLPGGKVRFKVEPK